MRKNIKKFTTKILSILVSISSISLAYIIFSLGVLPDKYVKPGLVALFIFTIIILVWLNVSEKKLPKIISFLLVLSLAFGTGQLSRVKSLISKIAGADSEVHTVNVIVMNESPYKSLKELKDLDLSFGANIAIDRTNIEKTVDAIEKKYKFRPEITEYNQYTNLVDDLYNGNSEVIIMSEAHASLMDEYKPDFAEETRVIASFEFKEDVKTNKYDANVLKDTYSVYISGIDTFGKISSVSRSDVNMLMTVNPNTNQILLTSIPRDYYLELASFNAYDKLTHAGLYGVNESVDSMENLLTKHSVEKVDIDYYLRVNFTSVLNIVDALGGVTVNSQYDFSSGGYHFVKGANEMDGKKALVFVRERYNLPGGDFSRIQNQQALITGVINKAMSPAIITNFGSFLSSVGDGFELSMSDSDLNKIIKNQLDTMESWEILQYQLKGTGRHDTKLYSWPNKSLYVVEPDVESIRKAAELITQMEKNERISLN